MLMYRIKILNISREKINQNQYFYHDSNMCLCVVYILLHLDAIFITRKLCHSILSGKKINVREKKEKENK